MTTNRITKNGFITEGPISETHNITFEGSGSMSIEHSVNFQSPISASGYINNFALLPRRQIFSMMDQQFTGSVHKLVKMSSSHATVPNTLQNFWDFTNHKFMFPYPNATYTIRVDGIVPSTGVTGAPYFHIDFDVSGSISTTTLSAHNVETNHRQGTDIVIESRGPLSPNHVHFHAVFIVYTDEDIVVSGAQLYAATSGGAVNFTSGTMLIKEG